MILATAARIPCLVPFCPRWCRGRTGEEWICWPHWRAVPLGRRKAYFRALAEHHPLWRERGRGPRPRWMLPRAARLAAPRARAAIDRLWDRIKRDAIARAL